MFNKLINIKKSILILTFVLMGLSSLNAQDQLITNEILLINAQDDTTYVDLEENNGPTVYIVYGPGCGICIKELKEISGRLNSWKNLYNARIIAFSRPYKKDYSKKIARMSNKYNIHLKLYIDINTDLANFISNTRGINLKHFSSIDNFHLIVPQTVVLSKENEVVYQKQGYQDGDDDKIEAILKTL